MALAKFPSAGVEGIDALPVVVEVDVATGLPGFTVVGLADKAVEESRERVRSAIKHSGYTFPLSRITVHLAPSDRKKSGLHYDLPIALGILVADGQLQIGAEHRKTLFLGGLSLDGRLQKSNGLLVLVEWAKKVGFEAVVLPRGNYQEAALITDITLVPLESLNQAVDYLLGRFTPELPLPRRSKGTDAAAEDWLQIQGQEQAKRAALIAAAGGHNLLLEGPPGAGKTLLARGLRALLPPLEYAELLEVTKLHSVAGSLRQTQSIDTMTRPFRSPHHTTSHVAIVGGGPQARPGEISLSHRGVLFLDELPEFPRVVVEALRQPLEDGEIFISRAAQTARYPAAFILVATMNPCPCGWLGSNQKDCQCAPHEIARYRKRISGPIVDRIDIYLRVPAVSLTELRQTTSHQEELDRYRSLVAKTRRSSQKRNGGVLNGQIKSRSINDLCAVTQDADDVLQRAADKFVITGRGYHKLLKVARTIADLADQEQISSAAISEALQYRFAADQ